MNDTSASSGPRDWEESYRTGDLPWDAGVPAPELLRRFGELQTQGRALVIGAGTGTNAIWLAEQGLDVTALDLAEAAVEQARAKAASAGRPEIRFLAQDWLTPELPVAEGSQDLIFDRGCFHCLDAEGRTTFAANAARALREGGHWICLAGSADEVNEAGGPPRLSVLELAQAVEPSFEFLDLQARRFRASEGAGSWSCVFRKRPAQPRVFRRQPR